MQATKMVTWTTKDGKQAEAEIVKTRLVCDDISYADGDNINLGRKVVDRLEITLRVNGAVQARDTYKPSILTKENYGNGVYEKLVTAGAYARLGNVYISEVDYNAIVAAIAEADAEAVGSGEFAAAKEKEAAKREQAAEAKYRARRDGICPQCLGWCYGDCTAK